MFNFQFCLKRSWVKVSHQIRRDLADRRIRDVRRSEVLRPELPARGVLPNIGLFLVLSRLIVAPWQGVALLEPSCGVAFSLFVPLGVIARGCGGCASL